MLFVFTPESFSRSPRNPVRLAPESPPVGTLAIGKAGAINAALMAISILAISRPPLREQLRQFRQEQTAKVRQESL